MENSKKPTINRAVKATLAGLCNALLLASTLLWPLQVARSQTAALVPNAKQQYLNANGTPLAGGSVYSYVPSTTVPKTTWSDPNQATPNSSPVTLDASGGAFIFGQGNYRQIVKDVNGNTIWDGFTSAYGSASPSGSTGTDTAPVGTILPWAGFNFNVPTNWQLAYGQAVSRTTYAQLLAAITISTTTGNCVSSSTTVSGFADTSQLRVGAPIEASCLPTGDTVASIVNGTSITVAVAATATGTFTVTAFPWGNGDGVSTFNLPDLRGRVLPGADAMGGTAASRLTSTYYGASASAPGVAGGTQSEQASTSIALSNIPTITSSGSNSISVNSGSRAVWSDTSGGSTALGGAGAQVNNISQLTSTGTNSISVTSSGTGGGSPAAAVSASFATIQPSLTMDYIIKVLPNTTGAGGVTSFGGMFGDIICGAGLTCAPVGSPAVNTVSCTTMTSSVLGCAKPDNTTITVSGGVLSAITSTVTLVNSTTLTSGFSAGTLLSSNGSTLAGVSLASPPAIGGTSPAAGTFTTLTATTLSATSATVGSLTDSSITGAIQCVQANSSGVLSGIGVGCNTSSGRTKLISPTTFYVSTAGTDTVGCGLASGASACRTRGYLVNSILIPNYDFGGQTVTVSIAAGTYTDSLQVSSPLQIGQAGPTGLVFSGDCTSGHTSDVLIQPAANAGYAYGFAFGFSARIQCQKLDQTTGVRAGQSNDMIDVGQGSRLLMGNPSLFGVRGDMTYGCNINPFNTFTVGPGQAYLEFDNDFTIDVGSCQVQTTGTPTNGSAVITVPNTTNIVKYMGIVATNVPLDAFVNSIVTNTSVTMGCFYTSPCQANGSPGAETVTFTGGGQSFIDSDSSSSFFTTNGDPSFSIIGTLANYPFYFSGWMFINDLSVSNAQGITWVNQGQGRGHCSVVSNLSILNTNFQGIPYFPCYALTPEASPSGVTVTAGSSTFTVGSATGIVRGQIATDVVNTTATWTAGSSTMTVASATGIVVGAKVTGPGVLGGAFVSNIAGTTITVSGCGSGPRCVTGSPLYLSGSGTTVYFSNGLFSGASVVTNISGTTITISDTIKNTGTASNVWFQGRVTAPGTSVYD